ncbi:hypothetical protein [Streptomyces prasinopilosus]|nr:hypothetical protein [Streptomyces prasinopilosus]
MARDATEIITAAAATEYQHYVEVREGRSRLPSSAPPPSFHEPGSENPGTGAVRFAADTGGVHEPYSAGVAAVVAVLAPVLAGAVAAFSLLVGFLLKAFVPESAFAHILLTVGWISGAVAGVAIVVAGVGLLITALRHGPPIDTGRDGEPSGEVALARAAWREALRERGIVPFLREALADPGTAAAVHPEAPSEPTGRIPHFGYGRSGFTSPKEGPAPRSRPRFTSPDYAGPADSGPSASPEDPDETSSP